MGYDFDKYREKRERVLGSRRRGIGFPVIAGAVCGLLFIGAAILVVPPAVSYLQVRHLDDILYRDRTGDGWPATLISELENQEGVMSVLPDADTRRLVVTFDRRKTKPETLARLFEQHSVKVVVLNRMAHEQRRQMIESEAESEAI